MNGNGEKTADEENTGGENRGGAVEAAPQGAALIAAKVKLLPDSPGVYRMYDAGGDLLYVGKARSLKKRVTSYTKLAGHSNRIARMIASTAQMEFISTATETDALLLEANLIKRLKPRYNVLMRDDKSFPYILLTGDHDFPQALKHRGARSRKGDYYGPFASAGAVTATLNALQKAFLLRSCSDSVFESRTRPCLLFQIKRCSAPCTGEIDAEGYSKLVAEARDFLKGRSRKTQQQLVSLMDEASGELDFERAAIYRDRIRALTQIQQHQGINPRTVVEADLFAAWSEGGQTCVQVFFFRAGQNWGNRAYFPRHDKELSTEEVLDAFLAQFYEDRPPPRMVLLSHDVPGRPLLAEALTIRAERKVAVGVPRRGEKRELVDHALTNAREALGRRLAESSTQRKLLEGVAEAFDLEAPPQRIEVYDNSHISGTKAVGGMIVAGPEGFMKNQYRKFNIKGPDIEPGDDYAMMREVLTRRFTRLVKETGEKEGKEGEDAVWPDLILIDGGAGQLKVALEVLQELGIDNVTAVGVAKGPDRDAGRERFFMAGRADFMMEPRNPVLYYLQRLRDEAHRYAIGSHRARRSKAIGVNPLDEVPGIGPGRKRALLQHFGSARAVARAGLSDLESVNGISAKVARAVYDHFHGNPDTAP
ncbi:excinuclease ABC subunit UvrC [Parvibaculum sp.]|jgi:excinuclease ABC subunit C|uniref:excinuclease ABC subunit UvrC n=1 Tax=Parvibaculum sp. TaxID=2024848 RepID=UPI001AFE2B10|nr:excinuclease ABC subunit UvrC [Parvibaculum sp.]MBO6634593.1 excinuclease ABC subunit UvrC [Parvibaculum sp.]MBO6679659.1 excinuclease ABC subunit UvrC [Parvibaculum sp.]MBO6686744.1 excinuclease ABC subunit UvrC [Parvibaculum sp.]MBO6905436.1 excinuclease ABC subunit UvrC [Parvibaculum sp.]